MIYVTENKHTHAFDEANGYRILQHPSGQSTRIQLVKTPDGSKGRYLETLVGELVVVGSFSVKPEPGKSFFADKEDGSLKRVYHGTV